MEKLTKKTTNCISNKSVAISLNALQSAAISISFSWQYSFVSGCHRTDPALAYDGLAYHFSFLIFRFILFLKFKQIFYYSSKLWHLLFRTATLATAC